MPRISQPVSQIRLTNVVVVRLYKGGKRWELACYPNKVKDWREGKESDLSEVLQAERIFSNVHKGKFASEAELKEVFGDEAVKDRSAIKEILQKGFEQVNEYERKVVVADLMKEACTLAAERLMNVSTGMRLTPGVVENAFQHHKFTPKRGLTAKAIVPRVVKVLVAAYPDKIHPTLMKVMFKSTDIEILDRTREHLVDCLDAIIDQDSPDTKTLIFRILPKQLTKIEQFTAGTQTELNVISFSDDSPLPADRIQRLIEEKRTAAANNRRDSHSDKSDGGSLSELSSSSSSSDDEEPTPMSNMVLDRSEEKFSFLAAGNDLCLSDASSQDGERDTMGDGNILKEALNEYLEKERRDHPPSATGLKRHKLKEGGSKKKQGAGKTAIVAQKGQENHIIFPEDTRTPSAEPEIPIPLDSPPRSATWCDICSLDYADYGQSLKQHIKQDWHIFNHKRNVKGLSAISREVYLELASEVQDPSVLSSFRAVDE